MYLDTPELIKFVRDHANDYKDIPNCITFESDYYTGTRYFSVFIKEFGEISFKEVLNVFPLLPKSYLNK